MSELKKPEEYLASYLSHMKNYPCQTQVMRLDRKTNRHPETRGGSWGWYEIAPMGIDTRLFWGSDHDDISKADLETWNAEAAEVCRLGSDVVTRSKHATLAALKQKRESLMNQVRDADCLIEAIEQQFGIMANRRPASPLQSQWHLSPPVPGLYWASSWAKNWDIGDHFEVSSHDNGSDSWLTCRLQGGAVKSVGDSYFTQWVWWGPMPTRTPPTRTFIESALERTDGH